MRIYTLTGRIYFRQEMRLLAQIITGPLVTLFARVKRLIEEAEEVAK